MVVVLFRSSDGLASPPSPTPQVSNEEEFVTPRSPPERMDSDVVTDMQVATANVTLIIILYLPFCPSSLILRGLSLF